MQKVCINHDIKGITELLTAIGAQALFTYNLYTQIG